MSASFTRKWYIDHCTCTLIEKTCKTTALEKTPPPEPLVQIQNNWTEYSSKCPFSQIP